MHPQIKDRFYDSFLKEPNRENFVKFLKANCGEMDEIDFKGQWIEKGDLAKTILAMANSLGGVIVFGVAENKETHTFVLDGIEQLRDKANVNNEIAKFLPSELAYEIYDFVYDESIYSEFQGKKFQILVIPSMPQSVPFISLGASEKQIEKGAIYIRRGTKCEKVTPAELEHLIELHMDNLYKGGTSELSLKLHLEQLRILYDEVPKKTKVLIRKGAPSGLQLMLSQISNSWVWGEKDEYEEIDNPHYPPESYEEFILRIIKAKKQRIESIIDIR